MIKTGLVIPYYNGAHFLNNWRLNDIIRANFDEVVFVDDQSGNYESNYLEKHCAEFGYSFIRNELNLGPLLSRLRGVEYLVKHDIDYFMFIDCDDLLFEELNRPVDINYDIITYGLRIRTLSNDIRIKTFREGEYLAVKNHPSMLGRWFKVETILPKFKIFADEFSYLRFAEDLCFMLFLSFFDYKNMTRSRVAILNIKRHGSLSHKASYDPVITNAAILEVLFFALREYKESLNLKFLCQLYLIRHSLFSMHKREYLMLFFTLIKRGEVKNIGSILLILPERIIVKRHV